MTDNKVQTELAVYRVFVARPLRPRARVQDVFAYLTVAESAEQAVQQARRFFAERTAGAGDIVACRRFTDLASLIMSGAFTYKPAYVDELRASFAKQFPTE